MLFAIRHTIARRCCFSRLRLMSLNNGVRQITTADLPAGRRSLHQGGHMASRHHRHNHRFINQRIPHQATTMLANEPHTIRVIAGSINTGNGVTPHDMPPLFDAAAASFAAADYFAAAPADMPPLRYHRRTGAFSHTTPDKMSFCRSIRLRRHFRSAPLRYQYHFAAPPLRQRLPMLRHVIATSDIIFIELLILLSYLRHYFFAYYSEAYAAAIVACFRCSLIYVFHIDYFRCIATDITNEYAIRYCFRYFLRRA